MSGDCDLVEVLAHEPSHVPDVYFGQGYGQADARSQAGAWVTFAVPSGDWQMPVVLVELGNGSREAIGPYGYAGIHVADGVSAEAATDAWDSTHDALRDLGVVSLFLRFSPLESNVVAMTDRFADLSVQRTRTTYVVNIGEREAMWDRLRSSCRSRIRKALKNGYTAEVRPASLADLAPTGAFRQLYEQTMQRRAAAAHYFFDDDYYGELLGGLGQDLLLSEVRDVDGVVVSSSLLMRHGRRLHYHLAGSKVDGALMGSNNLMMWTAIEFAFEQGLEQFHLGGGRIESDGLARFKSTFGGEPKDFHTGRAIIDAEAYSRLTKERAEQLGTTVVALEESGYFPAFRASAG